MSTALYHFLFEDGAAENILKENTKKFKKDFKVVTNGMKFSEDKSTQNIQKLSTYDKATGESEVTDVSNKATYTGFLISVKKIIVDYKCFISNFF